MVSLAQLQRLGFDERAIQRRVAAARLHRVHRGIYAVGHAALSLEGRWLAGVMALGQGPRDEGGLALDRWGAAISHRSAASVWGMLPAAPGPCDVILAGNGGRARRAGIRVHRSLSLSPTDVTLRGGIPVTTPVRTIADLRRAISMRLPDAISGRELRRAVRQANVVGLPVGDDDVADRTRSDLEQAFLAICMRNGLPRPEINVRIGPFLVDFLWREAWLVVETDGYRYHRGQATFQDDHARSLELTRQGYEVIRLSEQQIDDEADRVAETLASKLAGSGKRWS